MPGHVDDSTTTTTSSTRKDSSTTSTRKDSSTTSTTKETSKLTSKTLATTSTKSMSTTSSPATTPIVRSNLGPLTTTTWTPPAQCTYFGPGNNDASANVFFLAQSCASSEPHDATACWPPATTTVSDTNLLFGYGYYSPGVVCPPGYTQACAQAPPLGDLTGSVSKLKSFSFQYDQVDGETAIGCCPTGMSCTVQAQGIQTCVVVTSSISVSIGLCSGDSSKYAHVSRISVGKANSAFYGPLIQLIYQATDKLSAATSTTLITSTSPSSAPTSASSSTAGTSVDQDGSSGGLSNGAKIGIGVGVPLGVLLLAGLAFFFFFRRRRQRYAPAPMDIPYNAPNTEKNIPAAQYEPPQSAKELVSAHGTSELDSNTAPVVHELSSDASPR